MTTLSIIFLAIIAINSLFDCCFKKIDDKFDGLSFMFDLAIFMLAVMCIGSIV